MADEDGHKMAFQPNFVMLKHAAVKKPHYNYDNKAGHP